jgi:branched-chain amino acid aminotransferase
LLAQQEGYENGCSQVMFLDAESSTYIEELGGMNLFFVFRDGSVVTPPLDGTILHGITRDSVITLLKDRNVHIQERKFLLAELQNSASSGELVEVFACGTAAVITPVGLFKSKNGEIEVSGQRPGDLTVSLRQELTDIQYGRIADRHGWLVKLAD